MNRMLCVLVALVCACGNGNGKVTKTKDAAPDLSIAPEVRQEVDAGAVVQFADPVPNPAAAARAFKLYYSERVERVLVSYNRFMLFGDITFATNIGKAGVARQGDQWEVVSGPNDNNQIGVSIWNTWQGYKTFRSRPMALSLIRMFNGLVFFEAVSGHPGVTSRMVFPGWTRVVDGPADTVTRTRGGQTVLPPVSPDSALEAEILAAFFDDFQVTYREDPEDILLAYMPTAEVGPYAVTYSFSMLPDYLRVSDCCTSAKRTPAPYLWEGAFWGNHNSRDNFPDLAMGYLAALAAMDDPDADDDVRAAASDAWAAGRRIGDSIQEHEGKLMTVDEHNPYDTLVVAGGVRPDGETEVEDLGSLSDCQMVFLARALSTKGLTLPLPELPAPGSLEFMFADILGSDGQCPVEEPVRLCTGLAAAYCDKDWGTIHELELMGKPWLEIVAELEETNPGSAKDLIGGFQDDFYEKTIAILGVVHYAQITGDGGLENAAISALQQITSLMRQFAELMYAQTSPGEFVSKLYYAALFDAQAGVDVSLGHLDTFSRAEYQMTLLEAMLDLPDTQPKALLTDDEIKAIVEARLAGSSGTVKQRYLDHYGDTPPLRRAGEGYEARNYHPDHEWPWQPVDNHHHHVLGGVKLLEALPLCVTAPHFLDCTWARLGCARPDLDKSGAVDEADQILHETLLAKYTAAACDSTNDWCEDADLDRTGSVDSTDTQFMTAAQGCHY